MIGYYYQGTAQDFTSLQNVGATDPRITGAAQYEVDGLRDQAAEQGLTIIGTNELWFAKVEGMVVIAGYAKDAQEFFAKASQFVNNN